MFFLLTMSNEINARLRELFRKNISRSRKSNADVGEKEDLELEVKIMPPTKVAGEMATYFHVGGWAKELLVYGFKPGAWPMQCSSWSRDKIYFSSFGEGYPTLKSVFGGVEFYRGSQNFHTSYGWLSSQDFLNEIGFKGQGIGGSWYAVLKSVLGTKTE